MKAAFSLPSAAIPIVYLRELGLPDHADLGKKGQECEGAPAEAEPHEDVVVLYQKRFTIAGVVNLGGKKCLVV